MQTLVEIGPSNASQGCAGSKSERASYFLFVPLLSFFGVVVRMSILDTKVAGSNLSINMFSP